MKVLLIVTQIIYLLCLFPWFLIWGLSFMSFDNGFNFYNIAFVLFISLYPIVALACSIIAWSLLKRKKRTATVINFIPML